MNLVILVEQSYMDSNIKKHLSNHFKLKYNLTYINRSYGNVVGSIGSLVGTSDDLNIQKEILFILSDLEKYSPFIRFLGVHYNGYWLQRSQLKESISFNMENTNSYDLVTMYFGPISKLTHTIDYNIKSIIYLLTTKTNQ